MRQFYIQRHQSGYVGNCLLWWAKGHNGYTCNINEAHVFDEDDPQFISAMRSQDKYHAWEKSYIDDRTTVMVDHQSLEHDAWTKPEEIEKDTISVETIVKGGIDRRHKMCKCNDCGIIERCTPSNDFYTLPDKPDGFLYCERCLVKANNEKIKH